MTAFFTRPKGGTRSTDSAPPLTIDQAMGVQQQIQINKSESVSQEEADQLCDMVARMKVMAMDINREQDSQMDKIEHLSDTVDRANARVKRDTQRMNKLM